MKPYEIVLHDMLNPDAPEIVFNTQAEFCQFFNKTKSWGAQMFRRNRQFYKGYHIERRVKENTHNE